MAVHGSDPVQDFSCLSNDLRPNPITGNYRYIITHLYRLPLHNSVLSLYHADVFPFIIEHLKGFFNYITGFFCKILYEIGISTINGSYRNGAQNAFMFLPWHGNRCHCGGPV